MERLSDIFPAADRAIGRLPQVPEQNRLWVTRVNGSALLSPGLISICGLLGIMGGVQVGGTSDPFSSCSQEISCSRAYQIVVEGSPLDLVEIYGKNFNAEPVSSDRRASGYSFLYRGLTLCFACLPMELESTEGRSLTSRLKEMAPHLRSSFD
jgi:hypothetical protein